MSQIFKIQEIQRFGMYFFLSRIIHPLMVFPEKPKFDSKINLIAQEIASKIETDYKNLGHSTLFILKK